MRAATLTRAVRRAALLAALAAVAIIPAVAISAPPVDRVILKSGSEVTGEILKSDEQTVIVDLGCAVLRLARGDVARIDRHVGSGGATTQSDRTGPASQPTERAGSQWQLYRTAKSEPATVEKLAERNSEAVVMVTSPGGLGSGFVINPDGYLVTNHHVVAGETRITVTLFRKTAGGFENRHFKKVRIIAIDPFEDLALLKIEDAGGPLKFVYLANHDELAVGQDCFAIGNPLGLTRSVSQGIVSTRSRNFEGRLYIQTTTLINPGNSGGPLFNLKGEVIGVTSMGFRYLAGLNFAVPVDVVQRFILNRDAFAYDEDNPNSGVRYLQPGSRRNASNPPPGKWPTL
jgi:serine protease Do